MAARNGHKVFDRRFKMSDKLLASREYYIDVLKGMAMLAVILVHFNNAWNAPIGILNVVFHHFGLLDMDGVG